LGASESAGLRLRLTGVELLGAETLLTLDNPSTTGELVARIGGTPDVRSENDVDIALDIDEVHLFDPVTRKVLPRTPPPAAPLR
jgi:ABC-type sugar transport system ATPase subunit